VAEHKTFTNSGPWSGNDVKGC